MPNVNEEGTDAPKAPNPVNVDPVLLGFDESVPNLKVKGLGLASLVIGMSGLDEELGLAL